MQAEQPELALPTRLPKIGELWTPGGGAVCEVFNAWQSTPPESGVVVRWRGKVTDRKAYYTVAEFLRDFTRCDAHRDLFAGDTDDGHR